MTDYIILGDNVSQVAALIFAVVMVVRWLRNKGNSVVLGFLLYALVCLLISDIYWNAMSYLKPDLRIPFAASEIADIGTVLFLAAMLSEIYQDYRVKIGWETVCAAVHGAVSICLWTAWAGEWFKNVVGGIPYVYYLFVVVWSSKKIQPFRRYQKILIGIGIFALDIIQIIGLVSSEKITDLMNYISYGTIIFGIILLMIKLIHMLRRAYRERSYEWSRKTLAAALVTLVWVQNGMYMSYDPFYSIEDIGFTFTVLIIVCAVFCVHETARNTEKDWGMA
ncbi:MAG: hypothetical protein J5845_01640 [Lachnospiraceae bacterium]|nr:hypothetical protein [Lachnospiraceae bacterium]